jgi:aryl-alcohol dehydrogenase-like predicted oxidoreductase
LNQIVLGTLPFGSVLSEAESKKLIQLAWKGNIRKFDVGTLYGNGLAAEILPSALGDQMHNSEVWVSVGLEKVPDPNGVFSVNVQKLTSNYLRKSVDQMRSQLKVESINVLNIHGPDPSTPFEETLEELLRLKASGKIQKISISNFIPSELEEILDVDSKFGGGLDIFQFHGNLLEQRLINEFKASLQQNDKSVYCYRPFARGLLTRKYSRKNPKPSDSRSTRGWRLDSYLTEEVLVQLEHLNDLIDSYSYSSIHVSLYWLLSLSKIDGAIVGIRTEDQLNDLIAFKNFEPSNQFKSDFEKYTQNLDFSTIAEHLPYHYFEK